MSEMQDKIKAWCDEVAATCHQYAVAHDIDFYCFQSAIPVKRPELLIVGLNPGGAGTYSDALKTLTMKWGYDVKARTGDMLAQGINMYSVLHPVPENHQMVSALRRFLTTSFLQETVEEATCMNIYYFNTVGSADLDALLSAEIKAYCRRKTREMIGILKPKHVLFLTIKNHELQAIGVTGIADNTHHTKTGWLDDLKVFAVPNHGYYRAYSYANASEMGRLFEEYLRQ